MRLGSLFSGGGGLDRAVEAVFGAETAWQCEVDPAAAKVLAHRWLGVPNLGDITAVDWASVEPVDVLCGGFPCQDVSAAGRRAGIKDGTRSGLWAIFADAIAALRPRYVVIENVRGLLSATAHRPMEREPDALGDRDSEPVLRAIGAVLGDLSDLGYDAQWATVSAASVGAPHRRERVFIVATPTADADKSGWAARDRRRGEQRSSGTSRVSADAASHGRDERRPEPARFIGGSDAAIGGNEPGDNLDVEWSPGGNDAELARERGMATVDLLPTPTAQAAKHGADSRFGGGNGDASNLWQIAHLLPTPTSRDGKGANQRGDDTCLAGALLPTPNAQDGGRYSSEGHQRTLPGEARLLPTPAASDGAGGKTSRSGDRIDEPLLGGIARDFTGQWGKYAPAIARWEQIAGPAPSPTEPNRAGNPRLNPAFSEWMMGWPAGWVTDVPGISRNDALRIIGNGVVSQCAEAALRYLLGVACEVVA